MNNRFYIYAHSTNAEPTIDGIFYIGKGTGNRAKRKNHRGNYWKNFTNKINHQYYIHYIWSDLYEHEALFLEKLYIDILGRKIDGGMLVNLTDGGEGVSGYKHTEETKRRLSEKSIGRKMPEQMVENMRKRFAGSGNPRYGVELTQEIKQKISQANKGRFANEKHHNYKGRICQIDKNGNLIAIWNDTNQIKKELNIVPAGVRNVINKYRKTAGGYIWIRECDYKKSVSNL